MLYIVQYATAGRVVPKDYIIVLYTFLKLSRFSETIISSIYLVVNVDRFNSEAFVITVM